MAELLDRQAFADLAVQVAATHTHPGCLLCEAVEASIQKIAAEGRALVEEQRERGQT